MLGISKNLWKHNIIKSDDSLKEMLENMVAEATDNIKEDSVKYVVKLGRIK